MAYPATAWLGKRRATRQLARRSLLPSAVWKRLPAPRPTVVELPGGASFRYQGPFDRELCWRGLDWIEGATIRPFADLAVEARRVVDIGANTGLYTLVACAASRTLDVVAFEPVSENVAAMISNLAANGWRDRCDLRSRAVSNMHGTQSFHVPFDEYPVSASLSTNGFRGLSGELRTVDVRTLDEELDASPAVDVVKIDVEGFEHLVLEGMATTIRRCRPAIVLECNPDGESGAITDILMSHQYALFHLVDTGPRKVARILPDESERFRNFLCVGRDEHLPENRRR